MNEYILKRSNRRTVSLEITDSLEVLVRSPAHMPKSALDRFVEANSAWIREHTEKKRARIEARPILSEEKISALKRRAAAIIPERVEYYGSLLSLSPSAVKITSAEKRFGSCSGKNSLCFSFRLMLFPDAAVDYVIVHELAHILHKNHGRAFYSLIESIMPDYKERRKLLK